MLADDLLNFAQMVADRVASVPGVLAVTLGGSRIQGDHKPDSDWDFGMYYRGHLDPDEVRALCWAGTVVAPGDWGPIMNGGAWLEVQGRRVDLHYRDLDVVEHWTAEAQRGRFQVERLPFYLAGIPTYILTGELAISQVLVGHLPHPEFPTALRETAFRWWRNAARLSCDYAEAAYAARGDALGCAGSLARAVIEAAHSQLAARGIWALNEKRIVGLAGLAGTCHYFEQLGDSPEDLAQAVRMVRAALKV